MTQLGAVTLRRTYWYCDSCGTAVVPADAAWEVPATGASFGARAAAALLGTVVPSFARAADLLAALTPMTLSARSLESYTETLGDAYTLPVLAPDDPGPAADLLVVEVDGGHLPFRGDGWREAKAVMAWREVAGVAQPPRYAAVQGAWATHEDVVWAVARREGARQARTILCLADGNRLQWAMLEGLFPHAVFLLDWYHLLEHVGAVAALLPDGDAWQQAQRAALWERGPRETLRALLGLLRDAALPAATRELVRQCFGYLWHNRHRMAYAEARQRGYPCGSGRIESGIKQVLQARLKGPGMRWDHDHAQAMLNAVCAWLSGDWALACTQVKVQACGPPAPPRVGPRTRPRLARAGLLPPPPPSRRVAVPRPPGLSTRQAAAIVKRAMRLR